MSRNLWLKIHLFLVGLFLPLLFIIPLSGTQYLLGIKGEAVKTDAFSVETPYTTDADVIRALFKTQKIDFDFEYVKSRGNHSVLRPATRDHYEVHKTDTGMTFKKVEPNWIKILQELHFGHGPKLMKKVQIAFGIAFFLLIHSGMILTLSLKKRLPLFGAAFGLGLIVMVVASL
jgi:hypothetical protein